MGLLPSLVIAAAVAYGIYRLVRPQPTDFTTSSVGRKWSAWALAAATMAFLPGALLRSLAVNVTAVWLLNLVVWGGAAFLLGLCWGRLTARRRYKAAGLNELMIAAANGDLTALAACLTRGDNPNLRSPTGTTALMYAAQRGNEQVVRALLAAGADVSMRAPKGTTASQQAIAHGHTAVAGILNGSVSQPTATPAPTAAPLPAGPMGTCPNCHTAVALASKECPSCKALFGVGSAWRVTPP